MKPSTGTWAKSELRRGLILVPYVVLFWLLLPALLIGSGRFLDAKLNLRFGFSGFLLGLGIAVAGFSVYMLVRAILDFRRYGAELPVSALPPRRVIQQGLFTYWRHPIYLFYTLVFAGLALILRSGAMLAITLPVFVVFESLYVVAEERTLARRFGPAYEHYRKRTPLVVPRLGTLARPLFAMLCRALFNWEIRNQERIPTEPPFFLVATHRNYLDPFFVAYAVRFPTCFVTTFEMFRKPLLGFLFRRFLCIPKRRYLNDLGAGREIIARLKQGFVIGVFPEGERSWTGQTRDWKPEAVALFNRFPEVPILPIRIDGNYLAWPRWAGGIRRAKALLTIQEPFRVAPGMTPEDIERELRAKVEPIDHNLRTRSKPHAAGIERVIYRCPHCGSWKPLVSAGESEFLCPSCETRFQLEPDYQVRSEGKSESLSAVYDRIRVRNADLGPHSSARSPQSAELNHREQEEPGIPGSDSSVTSVSSVVSSAVDGEAVLWQESDNALKRLGTGRLALTNQHLEFSNDKLVVQMPLDQVRSVTVESNSRLQVWLGSERPLYQLTFPRESVLKWQDFIVAAIEREFHLSPNRR